MHAPADLETNDNPVRFKERLGEVMKHKPVLEKPE